MASNRSGRMSADDDSPPWIPPRKRTLLEANMSPATSSEASPSNQNTDNECAERGPVCNGACPTALVVSPRAAKVVSNQELNEDADDAVEEDVVKDAPVNPYKCTRRNARCTHCTKRTSRWPGTLCESCGAHWRKTGVPANAKKCAHCGDADTCRWLRGPKGVQTLCNACGKRWAKTGSLEYMRNSKSGTGNLGDTNTRMSTRASTRLPKRESQTVRSPQCTHCGTRNTRKWCSGPAGRRTLCDDCGVRWRRGEMPLVGTVSNELKKEEDVPKVDDNNEVQNNDEVRAVATQARNGKHPASASPAYDPRYPKLTVEYDDVYDADNNDEEVDDDAEDEDIDEDEIMVAYQPTPSNLNVPNATNGATNGATGTIAMNSPSRDDDVNNSGTSSKGKGLLDEVEKLKKACELIEFVLQSPNPNLKRIEALNQFIACGFETLRIETHRTFSN